MYLSDILMVTLYFFDVEGSKRNKGTLQFNEEE